jgi:SAM-dependent methyltransferase
MTTTFDPHVYKRSTRQQWQEAAEAWHRWGPAIEDWLGKATEQMLDAAQVGTGSRVLDVAAGAGGQTLVAARRVGPSGYVLATDIAPALLEYAERSAAAEGLANVATQELDGEDLAVPEAAFDAVISRVGLIYFPNQQAALAGMRRALRPGVGCPPWSTRPPTATSSSPYRSGSSVAAPSFRRPPPVSPDRSVSAPRASRRRRCPEPGSGTSRSRPSRRRCGYRAPRTASDSNGNRSVRCTRCWPGSPKPSGRRRGPRSATS